MGRRKEVLTGLWRLLRDTGYRSRYWSLIRKCAPRLLPARLLPSPASHSGGAVWGSPLVTPFSREFGFDRGTPVDRFYIERFLSCCDADIRDRVLEIGDNSYTKRFGGNRVTRSDVLHPQEGNPQATFIGDLSSAEDIPVRCF
jgi:hypothetical protein